MSAQAVTPHRAGGAIVFRTAKKGGAYRTDPYVVGNPELHRRIVIFVHGYNVYHDAACAAFQSMHRGLWERENRPILHNIFWLFWPGDIAGFTKLGSALSYSWQVPKARDLSEHIATWLRKVRRESASSYPEEVIFVAHSLGCRLTMETIKRLSKAPPGEAPRVAGYVLMAAAIPFRYCTQGRRFGPALDRTVAMRSNPALLPRKLIMWSGWDPVLMLAFREGQLLARESISQAVGRRGRPRWRWGDTLKTRFLHGAYWKKSTSIDAVMKSLVETVSANELPESTAEETGLPETESMPEHRLPELTIDNLCGRVGNEAYLPTV